MCGPHDQDFDFELNEDIERSRAMECGKKLIRKRWPLEDVQACYAVTEEHRNELALYAKSIVLAIGIGVVLFSSGPMATERLWPKGAHCYIPDGGLCGKCGTPEHDLCEYKAAKQEILQPLIKEHQDYINKAAPPYKCWEQWREGRIFCDLDVSNSERPKDCDRNEAFINPQLFCMNTETGRSWRVPDYPLVHHSDKDPGR